MINCHSAIFPVGTLRRPHRLRREHTSNSSPFLFSGRCGSRFPGYLATSADKPVLSRRSRSNVGTRPVLLMGGALFCYRGLHRPGRGRKRHKVSVCAVAISLLGGVLFASQHRLQATLRGRQFKIKFRGITASARDATYTDSPDSVGVGNNGHSEDLHIDVVQFGAAIYYVSENEGLLKVEVTRVGDLKEACTVSYTTESGSAVEGVCFRGQAGMLTFLPGEELKAIKIPIIDDEGWNATLEFTVRLFEAKGCTLGKAMSRARVKIIDNDVFPTNRIKYALQGDRIDESGSLDVFLEYCKMNLVSANVSEKSVQCLLIDQVPNLYFLLTTYLLQYVTDDVLVGKQDLLYPGDVNATLFVVAALYVVPQGGLYLIERYRLGLGVEEASRTLLQENLFRKFLDITDSSRSKISVSDLSMIFSQDIEDVVSSGFMKIFDVAANIGRIMVVSYFILAENPTAITPIVVYIVLIPFAFAGSYAKSASVNEKASDEGASLIETVQEGSANYRVIADYFMRPLLQETLQTKVLKYNKARKEVLVDDTDRRYISPVLGSVLVGLYMVYGSEQVLSGALNIGTFVATVNVFKDIADNFKDLYNNVLDVAKALGPLEKITVIMNMPSYSNQTRIFEEWRQRKTSELRGCSNFAQAARESGQRVLMDAMDIKMSNLQFRYGDGPPVLVNVNLSVPQGSFVAVVGPRHGGKSSLMRLIGQVALPTQGKVFISSHLRVLHVAQEPLILKGGLWRNVALNHQFGDLDAEQRIVSICRRIGFSDYLLDLMDEEKASGKRVQEQGSDWQERLSITDQVLISLARAFIYNAEVLVLHRPTNLLSIRLAKNVYAMLDDFVQNRGLQMPVSTVRLRRSRTVFVSCIRRFALEKVDTLLYVANGRVKSISKEEVSMEMLD